MSGQYGLTEEEQYYVKKLIEKYITCWDGDLYLDNEISIIFTATEAYIQIN